jgi:membrane protein required for colicin V production
MPITLLDGIVVGFTLVSAMLAMVRGFVARSAVGRLLGAGRCCRLLLLQARSCPTFSLTSTTKKIAMAPPPALSSSSR